MRKKSATLEPPALTSPTTQQKPTITAASLKPSPNGKPISEEAVRLCAYAKWEAAGKPGGDGIRFWLEAESELSQANK